MDDESAGQGYRENAAGARLAGKLHGAMVHLGRAISEPLEDVRRGFRRNARPGIGDSDSIDDACLTPIRPLKPEEIKAIRAKERGSQTVFANYLNVTSSLVSKWERGERRPSGASLKLLSLVEKNGLDAVA